MMKKVMFIFLIAAVYLVQAYPQLPDSACKYRMTLADRYLSGRNYTYLPEKAFKLYMECAENGEPRAMNCVGKMYMDGIGVDKNTTEALGWFEKAAQAGYIRAWHNLGLMYKDAKGVEQDFVKAYGYFKKAADKGYGSSMYYQGMMLYKGLGCTQDYNAAYNLFSEGVKKGSKGSMYMLGICLRNGYGTQRDSIAGIRWLSVAASKGYKLAQIELKSGEPENTNNRTEGRLKSAVVRNDLIPETYTNTIQNVHGNYITGVYTGFLITYDWSGRNIVQQEPLKLELTANGNLVTGLWTERNSFQTTVNAVLTDTALCFTDMKYARTEHYHQKDALVWEFKKANCGIVIADSDTYLAGTISFYLPELKEPAKPMYISLKKEIVNAKTKTSLTDDVTVYPNPFSDELNISVSLQKANDVKVCIYDMKGVVIEEKIFRNTPEGKNLFTLPLKLRPGNYIVKVTSGANKVTTIVAKQ